MSQTPLQALLVRTVQALGPYADRIVLVGGMAKDQYRLLPGFTDPGIPPIATVDIDLAIRAPLQLQDAGSVHRLLTEAGFVARERPGIDVPVVAVQYEHPDCSGTGGQVAPYLEFLTTEGRRSRDRSVNPRRAAIASLVQGRPQADLVAAPLAYVDLMIATALPPGKERPLAVVHPLCQVLVKHAIAQDRPSPTKGLRDLVDAYYVSMAFQSCWGAWHKELDTWRNSHGWRPLITRLRSTLPTVYADGRTPTTRQLAAALAPEPAELIARRMQLFVSMVLG